MAKGIAIVREGHKTWLKWHRARKHKTDLPFTAERILEGLRAGASVEVDLVRHADGGFAVLHDFHLDDGTTGTGLVAETSAAELRGLNLRDANGEPTSHRPMLLDDLAALIAAGTEISPEAILQLDLKENATALGAQEIAGFAEAIGPIARHFILSAGDASAVAMLAEALPLLALGYDPCEDGALERLMRSRDFAGFVTVAIAASPRAKMIYLEYRLVLLAADAGFDIVAAFHAAGRTIDAYTLNEASAETAAIAERLLALRVDQITTDDPVGLERLLQG